MKLAAQAFGLNAILPKGQFKFLRSHKLNWEGYIQPTALSPNYLIKINLASGGSPTISVLKPSLEKRGNLEIPHMYGQEHLCLYKPAYDEWNKTKSVARTIIPWTSLWLFHYEAWHATGIWHGGGEHPNVEN